MSKSDRLAIEPEAVAELHSALAGNPSLPAHLVDELTAVADIEILLAVAERDDLTISQVDCLTARGGSQVAVRLVQRRLLIADWADLSDPEVIVALAERGTVLAERMWRAAQP